MKTIRVTVLMLSALVADPARSVPCVDYLDFPLVQGSGRTPQPSSDVGVYGDRAYVTQGFTGLAVFDISDPSSPEPLPILPVDGYCIDVSGPHAYVFGGSFAGTQFFTHIDISNPSDPQVQGAVSLAGQYGYDVAVSGNYAYLATGLNLTVVDISTPSMPQVVWTGSGAAGAVAVSGGYAYGVNSSTFTVLSLGNPSSPVIVGSAGIPPFPGYGGFGVAVSGTWACVALGGTSLHVMDISNPAAPQLVTSVPLAANVEDVTVSGTVAYVATPGGVTLVDIQNPASAFVIETIAVPLYAASSYVSGVTTAGTPPRVYAATFYGLTILQLSADPFVQVATPGSAATGVAADGSLAYVADGSLGLQIIDLLMSPPQIVGSVDTPGFASELEVQWPWAYVATGYSGMRVIDVSNPQAPFEAGAIMPGGLTVNDVEVEGDVGYITSNGDISGSGFYTIDLSNDAAPQVIAYEPLVYYGDARFEVEGGATAYLADAYNGVQVIDVSDPQTPVVVFTTPTPGGYALDLDISWPYLYLVDTGGLHVFNLNNWGFVGSLWLPNLQRVTVDGNYAYVNESGFGPVHVIDVSNPFSPQLVTSISLGCCPSSTAMSDHGLLVASGEEGLKILPAQCGPTPNLIPVNPPAGGWAGTVVARNNTGATFTSVPLTPLDGNLANTSFNALWTNDGGATAGACQVTIAVDDAARWSAPVTPTGVGNYRYRINTPQGGPQSTVRGGRHHVQLRLDDLSQVVEEYEWDNTFTDWFAWSPLGLQDHAPVTEAAPPTPQPSGWGPWESCVGYRAAVDSVHWTAVASLPSGSAAMYDVRLHASTAGFGYRLVESNDLSSGDIEFCVVNHNMVPWNQPRDWSVVNVNGATDSYTVQQSNSTFLGTLINGVTYSGTIDFSGSILELFEFYVGPSLLGIPIYLSVNNLDATTDVRLDLFRAQVAYHSKSSTMASANANGVGGDEHLPPVTFTASGFYCIAVSKAAYAPPGPSRSAASLFELVFSTTTQVTDVPAPAGAAPPTEFALSAPRPNPSRGIASIELAVPPGRGAATVSVYDLAGRRIRSLVASESTAGRHLLSWDGRDGDGANVAAGVYFVRLQAAGVHESKKITLLR
ncbi:MAG: FlgD immunoglobulin-like domain containing protein [Candidatus Eiseniibacteriota bacterium]